MSSNVHRLIEAKTDIVSPNLGFLIASPLNNNKYLIQSDSDNHLKMIFI